MIKKVDCYQSIFEDGICTTCGKSIYLHPRVIAKDHYILKDGVPIPFIDTEKCSEEHFHISCNGLIFHLPYVFIRYYKYGFVFCNGTYHLLNEDQNKDDIYKASLYNNMSEEELRKEFDLEKIDCNCEELKFL